MIRQFDWSVIKIVFYLLNWNIYLFGHNDFLTLLSVHIVLMGVFSIITILNATKWDYGFIDVP